MKINIVNILIDEINNFQEKHPHCKQLILFVSPLIYSELNSTVNENPCCSVSKSVDYLYGAKIIEINLLSNLEIKIVDWKKI